MRPDIVVLCGSVRFAEEHLRVHRRLSLAGDIVLLPALPVLMEEAPSEAAASLAQLHRAKIELADRVHIVNPGGYVGDSTRDELAYAQRLGKSITYEH
jgi:hypothetical protein